MSRSLAKRFVLLFLGFYIPLRSEAIIGKCLLKLSEGAKFLSAYVRSPIPNNYEPVFERSGEVSDHKGGIFTVDVVQRVSDGRVFAHRQPISSYPRLNRAQRRELVELGWDSLRYQDKFLKRAHEEAAALGKKLSIPQSHGFTAGSKGKTVWASDYIEGDSVLNALVAITKEQRPVGVRLLEGLELMEQSYRAVMDLHDVGIVHVDMKTSNLVRRPDGVIVPIDFAGSFLRSEKKRNLYPPVTHYEPEYLPPEFSQRRFRLRDLERVKPDFDFYTLAKSFHKIFFSQLNPSDYLAHRQTVNGRMQQDLFKEYKEKVYDILTHNNPAVRRTFDPNVFKEILEKFKSLRR